MSIFATPAPIVTAAAPPRVNLTLDGVLLYPGVDKSATAAALALIAQLSNLCNATNTTACNYTAVSCVTQSFNETCVVGTSEDLKNILWLGLPALGVLAACLVIVSCFTTEDGHVTGARKIESDFVHPERYFNTAMTYLWEGTQLAGIAFGPATIKHLVPGNGAMAFLTAFFWNGGDWFHVYVACVVLVIIFILYLSVPIVLWHTLKEDEMNEFEENFVHGNFSWYYAIAIDCFLNYFTIPFMIGLTIMVPCEYYETGEPPTALLRTTDCSSADHNTYAALGGAVALVAFFVGAYAPCIPVIVRRHTDLALNGRFMSVNFQVKSMLAFIWVLFKDNHEWIHLVCVGVGLIWLLYLNVALRPCLVERINFHRSCTTILAMVPVVALIISAGLADKTNKMPEIFGALLIVATVIMLLLKYYVFPCGKLFPAIPYDVPVREKMGSIWSFLAPVREEDKENCCSALTKLMFVDNNASANKNAKKQKEEEEEQRKRANGDANYGGGGAGDLVPEGTAGEGEEDNHQQQQQPSAADASVTTDENGNEIAGAGDEIEQDENNNEQQAAAAAQDQQEEPEPEQEEIELLGEYEGGLVIGTAVPQGHGVLTWSREDRMWGGTFLFGKFHGYGVMTQFKSFFKGMHWFGHREGFGVTNQLEPEEEDFYEGNWHDGKMWGAGSKQYTDNDTYDGHFYDGVEDGEGVWSFDCGDLGRHSVSATWMRGLLAVADPAGDLHPFEFKPDERYEGDMRYGVPHGRGEMDIDGAVFRGEFRAGKLHGLGESIMEYPQFDRYEGQFVEGRREGVGKWWSDGEFYEGEWVADKRHGHGKSEMDDGTYEGTFVDDVRMGFGTFVGTDNSRYQGSWYHAMRHGAGTLRDAEGNEYEGFWYQNMRQGPRGTLRFADGGEYYGNWTDDTYDGDGVLRIPHMGEYHGRFYQGERHGNGRMTFVDGSEFMGEWTMGFPTGEGRFVFSSRKAIMLLSIMSLEDASLLEVKGPRNILDFGGVYEGEFEDGTMAGYGFVRTGDGAEYEGHWRNGMPEGDGEMVKASGHHYEGDFSAGNPHGRGVMEFPDGRRYEGQFAAGKRNGFGVLYSADNKVIFDCEWVNDVPEHMVGVKTEITDEDLPIDPVDIDELLRVIMPSSQTPVDIMQAAYRRRIEQEERACRFGICIVVEEETQFRHMMRAYLSRVEEDARMDLEEEWLLQACTIARSKMAHILTLWKKEYTLNHGGQAPGLSHLRAAPHYGNIHKMYDREVMPLERELKQKVDERMRRRGAGGGSVAGGGASAGGGGHRNH